MTNMIYLTNQPIDKKEKKKKYLHTSELLFRFYWNVKLLSSRRRIGFGKYYSHFSFDRFY